MDIEDRKIRFDQKKSEYEYFRYIFRMLNGQKAMKDLMKNIADM